MTSITSLCIKSQDRYEGNRTRFSIRLQYPIVFRRCYLENVMLPNSFYNMDNKLIVANDGGIHNATLNGIYSAQSLAAALQTQWGGGFTVVFDLDRQRYVISRAVPFTVAIPDTETARRMGFDSLNYASVANQVISDRPPDLQKYKNIFINIRELALGGLASNANSIAYTFKLTVQYNRGEYILYNEGANYQQPILVNGSDIKLSNFEVSLVGDDGLNIDQQQINDWSFSFRII